jgi:hypothetical protein
MKQARKVFGRWVQRITGNPRAELPTRPGQQRLQELDPQALTKVGGGVQATAQTPFKGW